jgi:hypothetical protein
MQTEYKILGCFGLKRNFSWCVTLIVSLVEIEHIIIVEVHL